MGFRRRNKEPYTELVQYKVKSLMHQMQKGRYKLGIIFNFNPSWMGGIIYIMNLIRTLGFLDDEEKPAIFLFYRQDLKKFVDQIKYPYLEIVEWNFPGVYIGYIQSWFSGNNVLIKNIISQFSLDGLYPLHDYPVRTSGKTKLISWYADLQHIYYPEFFTRKKYLERTLRIKLILKNSDHLIVSSKSVLNDFRKFFRLRDELLIHVFHFVSVIDDFSSLNINSLREKYNLPAEYFIISNQFHKHKNHIVLLKALLRLREKGKFVHLAMSGRFPEASHSHYMQEIHSIINENKLKSQITLLGIIPRNEQLLLMKHSQAVVQPSLFEGWSTVIEDAISLQVPVIASALDVNIEQLGPDGNYFEPHDDTKLAEILYSFPSRNTDDIFYENYNQRVKKAAITFMKILRD